MYFPHTYILHQIFSSCECMYTLRCPPLPVHEPARHCLARHCRLSCCECDCAPPECRTGPTGEGTCTNPVYACRGGRALDSWPSRQGRVGGWEEDVLATSESQTRRTNTFERRMHTCMYRLYTSPHSLRNSIISTAPFETRHYGLEWMGFRINLRRMPAAHPCSWKRGATVVVGVFER